MTVGEDGKSSENVNPRCFFDIEIGGLPAGRVIFELFSNVTPKTAENFRALCTGEKGIGKTTEKPLHYKGSVIHRVIKDFMIQGGDFSNGNGTGGESIYGGIFEDENFELQHDEPYLLSMANRGPATNGSQFFILTQAAPHLNGIHVVFGRVLHGQAIVKQIEGLPVDRKNRPLQDVKVSNSGELVLLKKKKEKKPKKDKKKKKDKGKDKNRDVKDGGKSSGEISDTTDSEGEKKKSHKEKKLPTDSPTVGSTTVVDVAHPLATESTLDAGEIPPDPPKRFLSRIAVEKDKDDKEVGSGDKKSKRDREKVRSRSRERERDRGDRDRGPDRNRDWRSNRDRGGGGGGGGGDRFAPRYGRSNFSATGRKIKGRGRVCYRTPSRSRSRSRSKTPPHWKAETRRTISMKEFEEKEKARKQREGELRRRQLERQKRHEEQEKDVPEPKQDKLPADDEELSNHSAEDALGSSPISKTLIDTLFEASNSDGVVYYQHLYNKGRDNRKGESSVSKSKENDDSEIVVASGSKSSESSPEEDKKEEFESIPLLLPRSSSKHPIVAVQSETSINVAKTMELVEDEDEEMRLRRELLKKRLKEWEDSSDEDKKAKQSVSRRQIHSESVGTKAASKTLKSSSEDTIQAKLMKFSQVNVDARISSKGREDRVRSKSRATASRSKSRSRSRDRRRDRQREKKRSRSRSRSRGRRDRERDRKRRRSTTKSSSSSRSRSRSRDRRRRR